MKKWTLTVLVVFSLWLTAIPSQAASLKEELTDRSLLQKLLEGQVLLIDPKLSWESAKFSKKDGYEIADLKALSFDAGSQQRPDSRVKILLNSLRVSKKIGTKTYRLEFGNQMNIRLSSPNKEDATRTDLTNVMIGLTKAVYFYEVPKNAELHSTFSADRVDIAVEAAGEKGSTTLFTISLNKLLADGTKYYDLAARPSAIKSKQSLSVKNVTLAMMEDEFVVIPADGSLKILVKLFGNAEKYLKAEGTVLTEKDPQKFMAGLSKWSKDGGKFQIENLEILGFGSPVNLQVEINFPDGADGQPLLNGSYILTINDWDSFMSKLKALRSKNGKVLVSAEFAAVLESLKLSFAETEGKKVILKITNNGTEIKSSKGLISARRP
ncbi:MAG: hypothetical protein QM523_09275 [Candidatus Pacebacteria bacterium]|nr:hypothetical protein [Candidatus Paceibacterota bacterium]